MTTAKSEGRSRVPVLWLAALAGMFFGGCDTPRQGAIRALRAYAALDVAALRENTCGDADETELLAAYVRFFDAAADAVAALNRLKADQAPREPSSVVADLPACATIREVLALLDPNTETIKAARVRITGDRAALRVVGEERILRLRRQAGRWRMEAASLLPQMWSGEDAPAEIRAVVQTPTFQRRSRLIMAEAFQRVGNAAERTIADAQRPGASFDKLSAAFWRELFDVMSRAGESVQWELRAQQYLDKEDGPPLMVRVSLGGLGYDLYCKQRRLNRTCPRLIVEDDAVFLKDLNQEPRRIELGRIRATFAQRGYMARPYPERQVLYQERTREADDPNSKRTELSNRAWKEAYLGGAVLVAYEELEGMLRRRAWAYAPGVREVPPPERVRIELLVRADRPARQALKDGRRVDLWGQLDPLPGRKESTRDWLVKGAQAWHVFTDPEDPDLLVVLVELPGKREEQWTALLNRAGYPLTMRVSSESNCDRHEKESLRINRSLVPRGPGRQGTR